MSGAWNALTGQTSGDTGTQGAAPVQWGQNAAANQAAAGQNALGAAAAKQLGAIGNTQGQAEAGQIGQLQGAEQNLAATAQGQGPAQAAAQAQLQQGVQQGLAAQLAAAGSSRGNAGIGLGQQAARSVGAGMQTAAAQQAALTQAQMAAQAQGTLANVSQQGAQGFGGLQNQAIIQGLGLQQGYQQQGLAAQNAAANVGLGNQSSQNQLAESNAGGVQRLIGGLASGVGGAIAAFADLDLVEPMDPSMDMSNSVAATSHLGMDPQLNPDMVPSPENGAMLGMVAHDQDMGGQEEEPVRSHITLREEPFGTVHINHLTGEVGKVMVEPLSPDEHAIVFGPHGAGPITAEAGHGRDATTAHDQDFAAQAGEAAGQALGASIGGAGVPGAASSAATGAASAGSSAAKPGKNKGMAAAGAGLSNFGASLSAADLDLKDEEGAEIPNGSLLAGVCGLDDQIRRLRAELAARKVGL